MRIHCICGARPNFMKVAALVDAAAARPELEIVVVHTGQHYDRRMSQVMFDDLGLPEPAVDLEVGSASHAQQTAEIMRRYEPVLTEHRPDLVAVVGDVNSTVACSLVASKLGVPVAHVEAGLRSHDRTMPEELNRIVTDALSDLLLVSERSGVENLAREGVPAHNVYLVGNVMIDTLLRNLERARSCVPAAAVDLPARGYVVLTLHRPVNVDDPARLSALVELVEEIAGRLPVVFPVHPRTGQRLRDLGLIERLVEHPEIRLLEPLGYLEFLGLASRARCLLTDSGGIQEEAVVLRVPCVTLRESTERPATVESGLNQVVGTDPERVRLALAKALELDTEAGVRIPEGWDGRAGERIVELLLELGPAGLRRLQAERAGSRS